MQAEEVLLKAKEFHGHICPNLALGVKASLIAMEKLGVSRDEDHTISEEILAIVETNNCFSDGVQVATGCTFGNNSLIYHDVGKNAFTLVRRSDWKAVRVYVDFDAVLANYFKERAVELFDRVIVRREEEESLMAEFRRTWEEIGWKLLGAEDVFRVSEVEAPRIEKAPIFESVRCERCGELVMSTRIRDGLCPSCREEFYAVVGRGIVRFSGGRYGEVG
ncbi:FmdE family protein [Geoglobus sp.]